MPKNPEKLAGPAKAAGADYPVDPAERIKQEARLKKAAAAGASASSSPIPGLMLQKVSTAPGAQKTAELPTATLSAPAPVRPIAERPYDQSGPRIENDEVLAELRKIVAWADLQRKTTRWAIILLVVLIPVAIGGFLLMHRDLNATLEANQAPQQPDWYEVDRNVRLGNLEKATTTGEQLILKTPQYPDAHVRLAGAYLAAGNLEKAKEHYTEAFRLFPSEENGRLLDAVEKRVQAEKPEPHETTP
jgi:tetratricopeptide (TPR) repeat protein